MAGLAFHSATMVYDKVTDMFPQLSVIAEDPPLAETKQSPDDPLISWDRHATALGPSLAMTGSQLPITNYGGFYHDNCSVTLRESIPFPFLLNGLWLMFLFFQNWLQFQMLLQQMMLSVILSLGRGLMRL